MMTHAMPATIAVAPTAMTPLAQPGRPVPCSGGGTGTNGRGEIARPQQSPIRGYGGLIEPRARVEREQPREGLGELLAL